MSDRSSAWTVRIASVAYAGVAYLAFLTVSVYAVAFLADKVVPRTVDTGGPIVSTLSALAVDGLLLAFFAFQHSVMARPAVKRRLNSYVPRHLERATFVLAASAVLAFTFWQWRPIPTAVWAVHAPVSRVVLWTLFAAGWALVVAMTFVVDHLDFVGLRQVHEFVRGRQPSAPPFRNPLPYRLVRHPMMVGFFPALLATPVMTGGHLLFALLGCGYILLAVRLEEHDLVDAHPEYAAYAAMTPRFLPLPRPSRRPARTKEREATHPAPHQAAAGASNQPATARRAQTLARLLDRYERVAILPAADRPVPATPEWTVRDVTAHLLTAADRYLAGPGGRMARADDPQTLPRLNEALLRQLPAVTHLDLLEQLRTRVVALVEQVNGFGDGQPTYLFNGGLPVRADRALGILAGEFAVHGGDIAALTRRRWAISASDVEVVLDGLEQVLPGWVNPQRCRRHNGAYDIRLRGGGTHAWTFAEGVLRIDNPPPRRFDCHLSVAPATLLRVMYRRRSPLTAALTGRAVAWGPKPWLALSLPARFHRP